MIAPHFVVEDMGIASIARDQQGLRDRRAAGKLARWHKDVDNAFYGWNGAWLDPKFRSWDISEYLAYIRVPVAILQGADDQYGTMRQIEIAQEECYCPVDVTIIPGAGHSPHREAPEATLHAISEFADRILRMHEGSQGGRPDASAAAMPVGASRRRSPAIAEDRHETKCRFSCPKGLDGIQNMHYCAY